MTSIPQGLFTSRVPRKKAESVLRGSSIGVGNDSGVGTDFVWSFEPSDVGRMRSFRPDEEEDVDEEEDFKRFRAFSLPSVDELDCNGACLLETRLDEENLDEDWARLRSIKIFLQMSLRAFAMALAGTSQRNTWHKCRLVFLSLAT